MFHSLCAPHSPQEDLERAEHDSDGDSCGDDNHLTHGEEYFADAETEEENTDVPSPDPRCGVCLCAT